MGLLIGGIIVCIIGLFFVVSAIITKVTGREIPIFKIFVAKSRMLWKDNVYNFYIISGLLMIVAGVIMSTNLLW